MSKIREQYKLPSITLLNIIVEFGLILVCVYVFIHPFLDPSPNTMYGGLNYPVTMLQHMFGTSIFQKTGSIPIWNPFVGFGEPLFENLASPLMNPLLSWPVFIFGVVNGGKAALLIHAVLMGFGGWTLGRMLRLGAAGRTFLGLLWLGSGSIVTQFGYGFIHLAFPQVYIPWVFAGLIGTLYMGRRWAVGMVAIASIMMVFAGGIWYVLPTAIGAAVISIFAIVDWNSVKRRFRIDTRMIRLLVIALVLCVGLGAIRWFTFNRALVYHPTANEGIGSTFFEIFRTYFEPVTARTEYQDLWINYHYVLERWLAVFIVVMRLLVYRPADSQRVGMWRILVPAALVFLFLTVWAEGDSVFTRFLYSAIPPLSDWKNAGRIGAGSTPWLMVMAAVWFDDIIYVLSQAGRGKYFTGPVQGMVKQITRLNQLKLRVKLPPALAWLVLAASLGLAFLLTMDTLDNWPRLVYMSKLDQWDRNEGKGVAYVRSLYPHQFLTVLTQGWIENFGFMTSLARAAQGDATIFTIGLPSTIGPDLSMRITQEFAVGSNPDFIGWLKNNGYEPLPGSPQAEGDAIAWVNHSLPPYAFWVERSKLDGRDWHPLTRDEVHDVTYYHQIDSVSTEIGDYAPDSVLVINETAYPGWIIQVDGQNAELQSVGNRLAVILPDKAPGSPPTYVTFRYKPPLLYLGGFVTMLSCLASALFLLRADRLIPASTRTRVRVIAQKAGYLLTTPELFKSEPQTEDGPASDEQPPDGKGEQEEIAQPVSEAEEAPSINGHSAAVDKPSNEPDSKQRRQR